MAQIDREKRTRMKIAVISSPVRGETDRLISEAAANLIAKGKKLLGAVKVLTNIEGANHDCNMDLRILPTGRMIRITQSLGAGSTSCRLHPGAIADAVAEVETTGAAGFDLFVLNKFGPQEAEGHGFCATIAEALSQDVPVLVGVGKACRSAFDDFAGGLAETLPAELPAILDWCENALAETEKTGKLAAKVAHTNTGSGGSS
jgi:hypothetical protein